MLVLIPYFKISKGLFFLSKVCTVRIIPGYIYVQGVHLLSLFWLTLLFFCHLVSKKKMATDHYFCCCRAVLLQI